MAAKPGGHIETLKPWRFVNDGNAVRRPGGQSGKSANDRNMANKRKYSWKKSAGFDERTVGRGFFKHVNRTASDAEMQVPVDRLPNIPVVKADKP